MSRSGDKELLVHVADSRHKISQKALIGCLIFGIAVVSLLIYGFIISLDLKSNHGLDPLDADLTDNAAEVCPYSEFDYLLLTVRWPLSDCAEGQCVPQIPNRWLVHGLWPNFENGSWPEFCCRSTPFKEAAIESLHPRLLEAWPNLLKHETASSLWGHEWNKHGTCSTRNPLIRGELNYFNHTLSLFDTVQVKKWLQSGGIVPGSRMISRNVIKNLLSTEFGKNVTVHCVSDGLSSSSPAPSTTTSTTTSPPLEEENKKPKNLESIHFCYDKTEISPIDCPDHDNCPDEFVLPSKV